MTDELPERPAPPIPAGHTLIGQIVATASASVVKADGTPRLPEDPIPPDVPEHLRTDRGESR